VRGWGDLRQGARTEEGVVLGDECLVGERAVINRGVKVYPFKTVEAGAIINSSIVWESRGARHLFGRDGVSGLANVDISPELTLKLAMAFGTTLKKGSTVVASRDSSRAARIFKRALMTGLNAVGVNVDDLELASVPVTRFQVRTAQSQGAVGSECRPEAVADFLVASLEGAILLTKLTKNIAVMEQCVVEMKRYLSLFEPRV